MGAAFNGEIRRPWNSTTAVPFTKGHKNIHTLDTSSHHLEETAEPSSISEQTPDHALRQLEGGPQRNQTGQDGGGGDMTRRRSGSFEVSPTSMGSAGLRDAVRALTQRMNEIDRPPPYMDNQSSRG